MVTLAESLRAIADLLDKHPELEDYDFADQRIWLFHYDNNTPEKVAQIARLLAPVTKEPIKQDYVLEKQVGKVKLRLHFSHANVCTKVVKGVRTVTEEVPDPEALAALPKVTVTREVEDVEWVCPDSLLAIAEKDDAIASGREPQEVA